jgi:hypothetical protein
MRMQNRAGAEKANAGNDLCRNACRVAVWMSVGREADFGDVNREMREECRADADEYVCTEARRFARDLALDTDRTAEDGREEEFEEQRKLQGLEPCIDRGPWCGGVLQQ